MKKSIIAYCLTDGTCEVSFQPAWCPAEDGMTDRKQESLRTSLSRTRSVVRRIIRYNQFEWFLTITMPDNADGTMPSRESMMHSTQNALRALKRKCDTPLQYLLVPELSPQDSVSPGRWHLHALVSHIPEQCMYAYDPKMPGLPALIYRRMAAGIQCYDVPALTSRMGFCLAEKIVQCPDSVERLTAYVSKGMYIDTTVKERYAHRITRSRNLVCPQKIYVSSITEREQQIIESQGIPYCKESGETVSFLLPRFVLENLLGRKPGK